MAESGLEYVLVEEPLIAQLVAMGWRHERGSTPGAAEPKDPGASLRGSFAEPVLEQLLRRKLRELNLDAHGDEWLDEPRITQMVNELTRLPSTTLLEANSVSTELLLVGTTVDGQPGWDSGRDQRVQYVDWAHPERNDFLVVSQFRMDVPGTSGQKSVVPDLVLFVNGIPLVVIECKKPAMHGGSISQAIEQLRRYANQREVKTQSEGSEPLFRTVQLTVATTGDKAMLGTYTSHPDHYTVWRDPYPLAKADLAVELSKDKDALWAQEILAAGVLRPVQLLDIVKNFVVFMDIATDEGGTRRVKIAPRYQQYRAVNRAVQRLVTGKTKRQDGKDDRRGGIIWHTQGSGKSLTMVFLVRKMRSTPGLSHFKIVLVTDRTQLQTQLSKTAVLTGETPDVVKRSKGVPAALRKKGAGLTFVMLQKQFDAAKVKQAAAADVLTHDRAVGWGELNDSEAVLILVDEAHRSHGSQLHQNLMESLPNAVRIGFTGTPIIMRAKNRTTDIFGAFIDQYRLADAEADGAIVPIFYEGRIAKAAIADAEDLDDAFATYFPELTEEDYDKLQQRYATTSDVLSADSLILKKARDMLAHYVANVMPNGFKGQLVAHSRKIAVRYRDALLHVRDEMVAEAEKLSPVVLDKPAERLTAKQAIAVAAHRQKELLKAIDFVPIISGDNNDDEDTAQWTDAKGHEDVVERFLKAFPDKPATGEKPVAFLIVRTMLLTGFDAPIEQVMYLDRRIKEADLLQAVARVNRTADGKAAGFIVDYAAVSKHLQAAMDAYAAEDAEGAPTNFSSEIARLEPRRNRLRMLFTERGVAPAGDKQTIEDCVQLLEDDELRSQFDSALRKFLTTVETVMPRQEAKRYLADARLYSLISTWARDRYQDCSDFDASLYGEKVRELIDEHITALGVKQVIPPRQLAASDFSDKVDALPGARAQASTMEHAIRRHIEVHLGEDPAEYTKLRERLEEILRDYAEQWEQQVLLFKDLGAKLIAVREGSSDHGSQRLLACSPLERALYGEMVSETIIDGVLREDAHNRLIGAAEKIEDEAVKHVRKKNFWSNPVAQGDLRAAVFRLLIDLDVADPSEVDHLADSLLDILGHHRHALQRRS
ncbi:HsdR family type I site-specific deoxyribonuclease [Streptomyces decoyicus]|uniref:type I restriction endonuclease subunit R n=1 Tax=Streptomyces decoyicus TaxID=249567 RepID=UPI0033FB7157